MGILLVIGGLMVATMCILSTILSGRAAGMGLGDIGYLSWTTLVAGTIWLGMLPVLAANAVLAYVDLRGRPAVRFGAEDAIWEQLSWVFTHPAIYLLALPVLGIALDVVSSATGSEPASRGVLLVATAAFGFLSFGAYAQSFFDTPGIPIMEEAIYVLAAFAIVPVALVVLGGVLDLLRRGGSDLGSRPPAPVVLSLIAVLLIVAGTVLGALRVVAPWDLLETSVTGAHFTLVVGAAVIGAVAGLSHWGEDLLGSPGFPGLMLLGGLAAALGVALIGAADAASGFLGQADFTGVDLATAGYPDSGTGALNAVSTLGAAAFLIAGLIWMVAGVRHLAADPVGAG
jgi:cytochrome c oxidase subunit 1